MAMRVLGKMLMAGLVLSVTVPAQAEVGLGADLVSRYIWRGSDFGNSAAVQPDLSYSRAMGSGSLAIGAWASWSLTGADADTVGASANENDLYLTYANGPVSVTLTDYYFPGSVGANDFFDYGDKGGSHTLEILGSVDLTKVSVTGGINLLGDYSAGDDETSFYVELGVPVPQRLTGKVEVGLSAAVGDGLYTLDNDPALVVIAVSASKDSYTASYILNPDSELAFLVFGRSF